MEFNLFRCLLLGVIKYGKSLLYRGRVRKGGERSTTVKYGFIRLIVQGRLCRHRTHRRSGPKSTRENWSRRNKVRPVWVDRLSFLCLSFVSRRGSRAPPPDPLPSSEEELSFFEESFLFLKSWYPFNFFFFFFFLFSFLLLTDERCTPSLHSC